MHGTAFWLLQAEIGRIQKMIFASKYYFQSTARWLGGRFKIIGLLVKIVTWQICFLHGTSNRHRAFVPYASSWCSGQKICSTPCKTKVCWLNWTKRMLLLRRPSTIFGVSTTASDISKGENLTEKETSALLIRTLKLSQLVMLNSFDYCLGVSSNHYLVVLIHNKRHSWLRFYLNWHCLCIIIMVVIKLYIHQRSRANTLVAILLTITHVWQVPTYLFKEPAFYVFNILEIRRVDWATHIWLFWTVIILFMGEF